MLRLFIAVEFSAALRGRLADVIETLRRAAPERAVNWVAPENIHLTLKFLGDIAEKDVPRLQTALTTAVGGFAPFSFTATGLGCFPSLKQPRVVWVGAEADGALRLVSLQAAVEAEVVRLGFPKEDRPFSPHITLGRVRRETRPPQAAQVGRAVAAAGVGPVGVESIDHISLMKSDLRRGGPVYTRLFSADLRGL